MSKLKTRAEIVEDIIVSFDDSYKQITAWPDQNGAFGALYVSFRGILVRAEKRLREAEAKPKRKVPSRSRS